MKWLKGLKPSEVKKGDVFRITLNQANGITPKPGDSNRDKYFVVLGFDNDGNVYGGVIFNSYINLKLPPFVQAMQCPIQKDAYDFLSHDSYIDCSSIKVVKKLKLLRSLYLGHLREDDLDMLYDKISTNSRISKIELRRFGISI